MDFWIPSNTFDWGLKTTLDAWLQIHSHLAGRCYPQCKLLRNTNIVRNMNKFLLGLVKPYLTTHREGVIPRVHLEARRALMMTMT